MSVFSRRLPWHAVVLFYDILMKSTSQCPHVPKSRFGNTVTEIWLACGLYNFLIGSTEFQLPKNMGTEPEIMFLGQLEGKMWQKVLFWQHCRKNLAIPLIEQFSNWVNWILCAEKHGYRAQNHVSRPIGRENVVKKRFLATLLRKSGNPVDCTFF